MAARGTSLTISALAILGSVSSSSLLRETPNANQATAIEEEWLRDLFPGDFEEVDQVFFDEPSRRVIARKESRFRDLVLDAGKAREPDPDQAASLLAEEVMAGRLKMRTWDRTVDKWINRINCLHHHCPVRAPARQT